MSGPLVHASEGAHTGTTPAQSGTKLRGSPPPWRLLGRPPRRPRPRPGAGRLLGRRASRLADGLGDRGLGRAGQLLLDGADRTLALLGVLLGDRLLELLALGLELAPVPAPGMAELVAGPELLPRYSSHTTQVRVSGWNMLID